MSGQLPANGSPPNCARRFTRLAESATRRVGLREQVGARDVFVLDAFGRVENGNLLRGILLYGQRNRLLKGQSA